MEPDQNDETYRKTGQTFTHKKVVGPSSVEPTKAAEESESTAVEAVEAVETDADDDDFSQYGNVTPSTQSDNFTPVSSNEFPAKPISQFILRLKLFGWYTIVTNGLGVVLAVTGLYYKADASWIRPTATALDLIWIGMGVIMLVSKQKWTIIRILRINIFVTLFILVLDVLTFNIIGIAIDIFTLGFLRNVAYTVGQIEQ